MDKRLKRALKQSFTPPPARYKEHFINSIPYSKAAFHEVLISQITFIRKRVWLSFALCVGFTLFYTTYGNTPESIVMGVSAVLPFFSLCTVTEIYKSAAFNMEEMELACKHNLPEIILMRIGILGAASFAMLIFLVIILGKSSFGMFRNVVYIGVPYLFTSYLSLLTISKLRSKETIYICTAISAAVSLFIVTAHNTCNFIYHVDFTFIWVMAFLVIAGLFLSSLVQFTKSQGELQWNLL